jgi:Tat protein translocase TatB subunit
MFGIGMTEMLLIAALALIVLGPKKLPDLARSLGKGFAEFKRATNELKNTIEVETRAAEVQQTKEKLEKEGKLTPADAAPIEDMEVSINPAPQMTSEEAAERIRAAKLAQTQYAEEDAEIDRQLEEENLSAATPKQTDAEQKQDV